MAKHSWEIQQAVVEQEIRFPRESVFEDFLRKLDLNYEPYKVVSKNYDNGALYVIIRRRYLEYDFLGETDPCSLEDWEREARDRANGIRWENGIKIISTPPK